MNTLKMSLIAVLTLLTSMPVAADDVNKQAASIQEAISDGMVSVNFRYRIEDVAQDNPLDDALASTLRSRLTYKTKPLHDFSVLTEVDNVFAIGSHKNYNSVRNGIGDHSVIADPEATEINQIALMYTGITNTKVALGRQRINLGNQRFVGGVAWRQNEQTYDGLTIANSSISDSKLTYAYAMNVNTILDTNVDTEAHLLEYNWTGSKVFTVSAYGYLLDFVDAAGASTSTYGARIQSAKNSDSNLVWAAEYAKQSDYADSPKDLSANYYLIEAGYKRNQWVVRLGHEVLSGDATTPGLAFQTPLATKHKFQGWADLFLSTPDAGVEDTYISVNTKWAGNKFVVVYHDFSAEASSADYGSEIDFVISRKFKGKYTGALKFADYSSDTHAVDTRKVWLTLGVNY